MSILELRGEITTIVSKVEDEEFLASIRDMLVETLVVDNDEQENLPREQRARLEYLKKRVRLKAHQVSDEEVWERLKQRRSR